MTLPVNDLSSLPTLTQSDRTNHGTPLKRVKMNPMSAGVALMSPSSGTERFELIDSIELASRWQVPESWIRNRTRVRTPKEERIPCLRLGRYVRFEWGSLRLADWLAKKRQ
jgi:hypothetical protein